MEKKREEKGRAHLEKKELEEPPASWAIPNPGVQGLSKSGTSGLGQSRPDLELDLSLAPGSVGPSSPQIKQVTSPPSTAP